MNPWERLQGLPEDPAERLKERAKRYKALFLLPEGQWVLEDLKVNYFFYDSTADENGILSQLKEGNRQVVLSILHALALNTDPQPEEQENDERANA